MDRILTNGRKLLTSNNNKLLVSRERTTGQRSGLKVVENHINIGNPTVFHNLQSFTIEGWVRMSSSLGYMGFLRKENTTGGFSFHKNGNNIALLITAPDGVVRGTGYDFTPYRNKWVYLAASFDGSTAKITHSANGIETHTFTSYVGAYSPNNASDVLIGGRLGGSGGCEYGFMRLFTGLRTAADSHRDAFRYLPADTPNLIEQWKLNEGVGTTVYGTKGNNGIITGTATWTTPSLMNYVGKQLSLNGTSQYVNTALSLSGSYTKECWVNPSSIAGTDNILSGGNTGFQLVDGKLSGGHNGNYQQVSDTVTITGHTHVAITYNDTTKLLSLYKNGLLIASATSASYTASVQQIGAFGGANLFHGKLDNVRVWNVARTQTQIQENMNRTLGREPGLVLNLGFESDYYDASGYGNHGTPVGSPVLEVTDNDKLLLNAPIN